MARMQKLKVYRTPIGFHDAYVAAPSQKAALEAWGTDRNLFARGIAEEVDDPGLTKEPLANPGAVIKRSRGTTAEQIAALPDDDPASARKKPPSSESGTSRSARKAIPKLRPASMPKPRRDRLDAAEQALAEAQERQVEDRDALSRRERDLARERDRLERGQARERDRLQRQVDKHRDDYERAIRDWKG